MTVPRWIAEAIEAAYDNGPGDGKLATALIERLPLEAMARALMQAQADRADPLAATVHVLTDDDPEVVELTELYQDACRALDDAGVPYALPMGDGVGPLLDLAGRIRWLAEQRPTRLALQRVEAERDAAFNEREDAGKEIVRLIDRNAATATERDHLRTMYECASDDLDRERSARQEAEAAASNRELTLTAELERERGGHLAVDAVLEVRDARVTALEDAVRAFVESDMPAGEMRRALAELIGPGYAIHIKRVDQANASMTEKLKAAEEARDEARARLQRFESVLSERDLEEIRDYKIRYEIASDAARAIEAEALRLAESRLSAKNMRKELRWLLGVKP